ncbi:MAE_28990/MAE_18760 family HEPN-like nuclease [Streptomyces sp. NPDC058992]|uniref:MAE_28990/MAE_18760 family HEPN-like nuclease n=1 Tax=Streptomyces sp. NPDC058992 TaxID=3346688 RepID=UPI0036A4C23C
MGAPSTFAGVDAAVVEFADSLNEVRQNLYYCDANFRQARLKDVRSNIHAASYVYVAAAVEKFINSALSAVIDEINSASIHYCDLRISLFAMIESNRLESLQQVRGLKMWKRRREVFSSLHEPSACQMSIEDLPLDGRTIRLDHLETIWEVFGFPGSSIPSPLHALALRDLADARNKIAHGEERASVVAGGKSITDTLRLYGKVEEVITHFWDASTDYLSSQSYRR